MSVALMTAVWRLDLATTDKMVLLALADAANDDGVTWIAVASRKQGDRLDLLKKTNLKERAIQGALKRLVEAGYLSREDRAGRGTIWTITPAPNAAPAYPAPRTTCAPAFDDTNPRISCGETVSNRQKKPISAREAEGFDRFWAVYPRRVGKDAARKALSKALGRITEDDPLAVILAGVERALPGWDDPNFIPHPASWLNAGRWDDEAPAKPVRTPNERPDRLTAKQNNLSRAWHGADRAAEILAARRAL